MKFLSESESLSPLSDSLSKLTIDYRFTRLRFGHLGTQHVVAEVDGLRLGFIEETEVVPPLSPLTNGSLESTSAITISCPR